MVKGSRYTMCVYSEGIACVEEAVIMDVVDVVYSDHVAVSVIMKWKIKDNNQSKRLHNKTCGSYAVWMEVERSLVI